MRNDKLILKSLFYTYKIGSECCWRVVSGSLHLLRPTDATHATTHWCIMLLGGGGPSDVVLSLSEYWLEWLQASAVVICKYDTLIVFVAIIVIIIRGGSSIKLISAIATGKLQLSHWFIMIFAEPPKHSVILLLDRVHLQAQMRVKVNFIMFIFYDVKCAVQWILMLSLLFLSVLTTIFICLLTNKSWGWSVFVLVNLIGSCVWWIIVVGAVVKIGYVAILSVNNYIKCQVWLQNLLHRETLLELFRRWAETRGQTALLVGTRTLK